MSLQPSLIARSFLIAYDELRRGFGRVETAAILAEVGMRNATGRPFRKVSKPVDAREAATRDELAPAVNLYQVLREWQGDARAFEIARRIILNSSLLHLRAIYPDFRRGSFLSLVEGGSDEAARRLAADFPFADTEVIEMSPLRAAFDVVACRIPATLASVDAGALASVFCEVDRLYFPIYEPDVKLERETTIAEGAGRCPFRLSWRDR